ncbi:hypothetical protein R1flu_021129 [Riccia fluitans]|uniref:GRPD C-terminal domain-containing protein n=1 Tax=Riccia fluitans TaxID=41844 RepID=A0ABD1ZQG2_9MARC
MATRSPSVASIRNPGYAVMKIDAYQNLFSPIKARYTVQVAVLSAAPVSAFPDPARQIRTCNLKEEAKLDQRTLMTSLVQAWGTCNSFLHSMPGLVFTLYLCRGHRPVIDRAKTSVKRCSAVATPSIRSLQFLRCHQNKWLLMDLYTHELMDRMTKSRRLKPEPDPQREWNGAQGIHISADLISAAKIQLAFLATVERSPCLYSDVDCIISAVERYENYWLPLVAKNPRGTSSGYPLVPPLDCAWISHLHQLSPVQYAKDCQDLFGKIIECGMLTFDTRDDATRESEELWLRHYPSEPYCLDMLAFQSQEGSHNLPDSHLQFGKSKTQQKGRLFRPPRVLNYDFIEAAKREKSFYYQVSQPYMSNTQFLFAAAMRYKAFLNLGVRNSTRSSASRVSLVPTFDIDLMWHSHMRCPTAYTSDTSRLLGYVLSHDDNSDTDRNYGIKSENGLKKTSELWEKLYGVEYTKAGVLYRGIVPRTELAPVVPKRFCGSGFLYEKKQTQPLKHSSMQDHLKRRLISEVRVGVIGMKNMKKNYRNMRLFLSLHKNSSSSFTFRAFDRHKRSPSIRKGACRFDEVVWEFQSDLSATEALNVYIDLTRERNVFCSGDRKFFKHSFVLNWSEVMQSYTFSTDRYYPVMKPPNTKPPAIRLAISTTPTMAGNILLRTMPEPTDNLGNAVTDSKASRQRYEQGRWLARSTYDHTGSVVYVVRTKDKPEAGQDISPLQEEESTARTVYVHKGGWITHRGPQYTTRVPSGPVVASAEQLQAENGIYSWSLFNGEAQLTVDMHDENNYTYILSESNVETVLLLRGRKLQYEVKSGKEEEEKYFVTLVRYRAANPLGAATALFNWKYGVFEISPEENVVLVLILAFATKMSFSDSIRLLGNYNEKTFDKFAFAGVRASHWGNTRQKQMEWWVCSDLSELNFTEGMSLPGEETHKASTRLPKDTTSESVWGYSFNSGQTGAASSPATIAAAG